MADYGQINNNHAASANPYHAKPVNGAGIGNTASQEGAASADSFGGLLKAQEDNEQQSANTCVRTKDGGREKRADGQDMDYRKQIQEHMAEMIDRIKHGTIQPKIAIGAQEYTQDEWKKLLEKFDDAEAELEEQLKEQIEVLKAQAQKEKAALADAAEANAKTEAVTEENEAE